MTKPVLLINMIIIGTIFFQCSHSKIDPIVEHADYNLQSHSLNIDYSANPDTSLLQIIALSNIRKSGYGILLNVEDSYSKSEMDTIIYKFKKLDINAVHSFDLSQTDTVPHKVLVAMEGSKFVWILSKKNINIKLTPLGNSISAIQNKKEDRTLIVH